MPTDKMLGGNRVTDTDPLQTQVMGGSVTLDAASITAILTALEHISATIEAPLGQAAAAASMPVVLASDNAALQIPAATTMQNAAGTGNPAGTSLVVTGEATAVLSVVSSTPMSGGTTVNFEGTTDDITWVSISGAPIGTSAGKQSTTTVDGDFRFNVAGYKSLRARISAWSAGVTTIKGYLSPVTGVPSVLGASIAETSGSVTILNGQTVSNAFDGRGYGSYAIVMPAAFTGTALSFQVSTDGVTYQLLKGEIDRTTISTQVATSGAFPLSLSLSRYRYFKLVSNSAEGADRVIQIVARAIPAQINPSGPGWIWAQMARNSTDNDSFGVFTVDPLANAIAVAVTPTLWDGTVRNRQRANMEQVLFASAARTASTNGDVINYNGRLVMVIINVSVMAAGGLTPAIRGKAATPGSYYQLHANFTKITTTGLYVYVVGLSALTAAAGGIAAVAQAPIPRVWNVNMVADDATSITYGIDVVTLV